jgi:hypothetical protein
MICFVPSALCGINSWINLFVRIASGTILWIKGDGDAIADPALTSNSSQDFPSRKF